MQNGAILLKAQFCTQHLQGSARWNTQINTSHHCRWIQTPPLEVDLPRTSFKAVPLRRGRTAPPPNEELEQEKFSELLKTSGCFRNQVPHLTWDHLSPSWRSRHRASWALNSGFSWSQSALEWRWDRSDSSTQNIAALDCEGPIPNVHCASTNNTSQNPRKKKRKELLTWENVTFSVLGGTERAARVPHLPGNYVIGWNLKKDI